MSNPQERESQFTTVPLPPATDQAFWAAELHRTFYEEETSTAAVKRVRCWRVAKELATGKRVVLKSDLEQD